MEPGARLWFALSMTWQPRAVLPHTDLEVGRIGLGSSFGVDAADLEYAYDHGINYFYWGSIRRPGFGEGIRRLARRHRDDIAVVLQSYARWPAALLRHAVEGGLRRLGLDHADVLLLGWYNQRPPQAILDEALALREEGRVGHLMMSGHQRPFFAEMAARTSSTSSWCATTRPTGAPNATSSRRCRPATRAPACAPTPPPGGARCSTRRRCPPARTCPAPATATASRCPTPPWT